MKNTRYFTTLGLAASLLVSACATTDQGQRAVGEKVTDLASTDAMLMAESAKARDILRRSGSRINDPALESYVQALAEKSSGDFAEEIDVFLLQAPVFNAFMMPNGTMGVNSGLLLRMETEDELALVLGHEFGHYYEKHSHEQFAAASNTNVAITLAGLAAGGVSAATGSYIDTSLFSTAAVAGFYSFGRGHEEEADIIGAERLKETGHDSKIAIRLWQNLESEKKASSIKAIRKRTSSIFDTHPTSEARLDTLKELVGVEGELPEPSIAKRQAYRAVIRPHLSEWLDDEVGRRDAGSTLHLLDRLEKVPGDEGLLQYTRARVIDRALNNKKLKKDKKTKELMIDQSSDTVIELLQASTQHSDAPPEAYRELGNMLYKNNDKAGAVDAFENYLKRNPAAEDASLIQSIISQGGS